MSERLTAERLAEIREAPRPPGARLAVLELVGHIAAQQAEIEAGNNAIGRALDEAGKAWIQVAALREALEGALEFGDRYLAEHERELCRLGDDTETAAKTHDQRLRLEGARQLVDYGKLQGCPTSRPGGGARVHGAVMIRIRLWCPTHGNIVEPEGEWPDTDQQFRNWVYRGQPILVPSLDEHTHPAEHTWKFDLTDLHCEEGEDPAYDDDCRASWQVEVITTP